MSISQCSEAVIEQLATGDKVDQISQHHRRRIVDLQEGQ